MLVQTHIVTAIGYYYLSLTKLPSTQVNSICVSIYVSNFSWFSTILVFIGSSQYIVRRIHYINTILTQLLFDQPLSDEFEFIHSNRPIVKDFQYINRLTIAHGQLITQKTNAKIFRRSTISINLNGNENFTPTRVQQLKKRTNGMENNNLMQEQSYRETNNWDPDIDKLIQSYSFTDIKMLRKM